MPVKIVLDHPRRYTFRRLWRRILMVIGAVLLVVGIAASIVAVPANVLAAAWFLDEDIDIEFEPGRTLSADEVLLAWAVSTPLAFFGVRRGLRLVRGRRSLVLFLRRFGYDDATSAVTFAVTRTIGSTWRLVTLDDAEIAALGMATSTTGIFRAIQLLSNGLHAHFAARCYRVPRDVVATGAHFVKMLGDKLGRGMGEGDLLQVLGDPRRL